MIEEIVEEKIVNIDSDFEHQKSESQEMEQRNRQIDEYLEMNKEEYLNKDEYNIDGSEPENLESHGYENFRQTEAYIDQDQDSNQEPEPEPENEEHEGHVDHDRVYERDTFQQNPEEGAQVDPPDLSPDILPQEEMYQQQYPEAEGEGYHEAEGEGSELVEEVKHAGLQTVFVDEKAQHLLYYVVEGFEPEQAVVDIDPEELEQDYGQYAHSPIQENEDEMYSSQNRDQLDYNDRARLFQLANQVKMKDQGKRFVLWEKSEMRNWWDEKEYSTMTKSKSMAKLEHHWNNDILRKLNSPKTKARNYDFSNIEEQNLPVHKGQRWHDNAESRIPMLTDTAICKKRVVGKRIEEGNQLSRIQKKKKSVNNIFEQSGSKVHNPRPKNRYEAPINPSAKGKKLKN